MPNGGRHAESKNLSEGEGSNHVTWKRGKWYWTDFAVNGQRYRLPLKTTDERAAKREEKKAIADAERGKLTVSGQSFARLAFSEAADRYLSERLPYLAPLSIRTETERARPLKAHFGATPLTRVGLEAIQGYVADRKAAGSATARSTWKWPCSAVY